MQRRAVSLVELLIAMSIAAALLISCISLVHTVFRQEQTARKSLADYRTLARLSRVFRADVHAAARFHEMAQTTDTLSCLELSGRQDERVRYEIGGGCIQRVWHDASKQQLAQREQFDFLQPCRLAFAVLPDPPRLALTVRFDAAGRASNARAAASGTRSGTGHETCIQAILARDLKYCPKGRTAAENEPTRD